MCYLIQKFLLGKYHQLQHDEAWYLRFHLWHLNQFRLLHLLGVNWWYFHYLESQIVTVFVSIFSSKFYEWQKRMQYFGQIQKYNRLPFSIARSNGIFPFKFFLLRSPPFWMSICITFSVPGNYDYFIIQSMKKIEFWMHSIWLFTKWSRNMNGTVAQVIDTVNLTAITLLNERCGSPIES